MGYSDFEWDEAKSEACFRERGFDFVYLTAGFTDPARVTWVDNRYDYGETRYVMICAIEQRHFVVVFTIRSRKIRIISGRKANNRERAMYDSRAT